MFLHCKGLLTKFHNNLFLSTINIINSLLTKTLELQHHIINCKSTAGRKPFQEKHCSGAQQLELWKSVCAVVENFQCPLEKNKCLTQTAPKMCLNKYHAKELHFHQPELHENWLIILLKTASLTDIVLLQ